jgi:hypothetical protein
MTRSSVALREEVDKIIAAVHDAAATFHTLGNAPGLRAIESMSSLIDRARVYMLVLLEREKEEE